MVVFERTSNSVGVRVRVYDEDTEWQEITVGGSVKLEWKITSTNESRLKNMFIRFSKKIPSDKLNYIVTYTHWEGKYKTCTRCTPVMRVHTDYVGVVYCPANVLTNCLYEFAVKISTDQLSPYATIYDDAELTDFMLRGEDGSVPFHKVVLAAHSSVFKTMLAGEWKETSEGVIDVPGTSKEILQHLKKYIYLGELPVNQNEQVDCMKQLLLLSLCYLMEDLKLRFIKELRFLLTPENVTDMIQFAMENKIHRLLTEIMDCTATRDIDPNEVLKELEGKDATQLQSE